MITVKGYIAVPRQYPYCHHCSRYRARHDAGTGTRVRYTGSPPHRRSPAEAKGVPLPFPPLLIAPAAEDIHYHTLCDGTFQDLQNCKLMNSVPKRNTSQKISGRQTAVLRDQHPITRWGPCTARRVTIATHSTRLQRMSAETGDGQNRSALSHQSFSGKEP